MIRRSVLATLTLMMVMLLPAVSAPAGGGVTYTVTKTADTADLNCSANDCSLREALMAANAAAGAETINVPAGRYRLTRVGDDDLGAVGDLDITGQGVTILGAGSDATIIDGNDIDRVLDIQPGSPGAIMNGLTIRDGRVTNEGGAGVWNSSAFFILTNVVLTSNSDDGAISNSSIGGAIRNNGTMILQNSTVSGNHAFRGGGIFNAGGATLTIGFTTMTGNTATGAAGIQTFGTTNIYESTISGNTGTGVVAAVEQGAPSGLTLLSNATIANNTPYGLGATADTTLENVILSDNGIGDCSANVVTSDGENMASDASCNLPAVSDQDSEDPLLEPLADNGGPTQTHALRKGSPAIDDGGPGCYGNDQRGALPSGNCDKGAYEYVTCGNRPVNLVGGLGPDVLVGSPGPDIALGQAGADTIKGKGGRDRLCGGDGDDLLLGGDGNDRLYGEDDIDNCSGGPGERDRAFTCEAIRSVP